MRQAQITCAERATTKLRHYARGSLNELVFFLIFRFRIL